MHQATLLATVVLLVSFETGLCVKCYQCVSTNNKDCKETFNAANVPTVDCEKNDVANFYNAYLSNVIPAPTTVNAPRYCMKLSIDGSTGPMVIRTCAEGPSSNPNKTCVELERTTTITGFVSSLTGRTLKHCSVCTGELCNSAHATTSGLSALFATFTAAVAAFVAY